MDRTHLVLIGKGALAIGGTVANAVIPGSGSLVTELFDAAAGVTGSIGGNLLSEDIGKWIARPDNPLVNEHLERAQRKAVRLLLEGVAGQQEGTACRALKGAASATGSLDVLTTEEVVRRFAVRAGTQLERVGTAEEWTGTVQHLHRVWQTERLGDRQRVPLEAAVAREAGKVLHERFVEAFRSIVKEPEDGGTQAFVALVLQMLGEVLALTRERGGEAAGLHTQAVDAFKAVLDEHGVMLQRHHAALLARLAEQDEGLRQAVADVQGHTTREADRTIQTLTNVIERRWDAEAPKEETLTAWNLPYTQNPDFTGREEQLDAIHYALTQGHRATLTALQGMGGVGKTQIALEYAYRHHADYDVVWWVRAEDPDTLAADLNELAYQLRLVDRTVGVEDARVVLLRWLRQHTRWLLIFDNAPNPRAIESFLPTPTQGHILATSRDPNWRRAIPVDTWPREEAVAFLLQRTGQGEGEREAVGRLAELLGDLPLALEQAAAYVAETPCSFETYLARYREDSGPLLDFTPADASYPNTVSKTWLLSFQRMEAEEPAAAALLRVCAFLAPDDIPGDLLRTHAWPKPLETARQTGAGWDRAVRVARRYGLLKVKGDRLSVHRLVQEVTRDQLREEREKWARLAFEAMSALFPEEILGNVAVWPTCGVLAPHALAAIDHVEREAGAAASATELLSSLGLYAYDRADYHGADQLFRRVVASREAALGPDHPATLSSVNNLATLLRARGDFAGAEPLYRRALAGSEAALGPGHPGTLSSVSSLGSLLRALGDLAGAEPLYRRALAGSEAALGPDHPDTLRSVSNLGSFLQGRGDLAGAEPLCRRALAGREVALGPDHPDTLLSVNNLGHLLLARGDLAGAEPLCRRALAGYEAALGPDHPDTLRSVNNLAGLLDTRGDLAGAEPLYRRALAGREAALGPHHPDTLLSLHNLGGLLRARGDLDGAEPLCRRALEGFEVKLGPGHPTTRVVRDNLEGLLREKQTRDEAS